MNIEQNELDFINNCIDCLELEVIELEKMEEIQNYRDKNVLLDYFNRMKYDNTKNTSNISVINIMNDIDKLRINSFVKRYITICEQLKTYKKLQKIFYDSTKQKTKVVNLWEN